MRPSTVLAVTLTLMPLTGGAGARADSGQPAYSIIVNPNNPETTADREFLADAFLKKITTWPTGAAIHPVDLPSSSPVRRQFCEEVLHRSVEEVKSYWQQRIFAGREVPPPELDTDDEVVTYVLKHDGAIGYVSRDAKLNGAKVLGVR